jgi:hypothetical protein
MNASLGQSLRNLPGRNVWGSFQYFAVRPQYEPVFEMEGGSAYGYSADRAHGIQFLFQQGQGMLSFRHQRYLLSSWCLPQLFCGLSVPEVTWPSLA